MTRLARFLCAAALIFSAVSGCGEDGDERNSFTSFTEPDSNLIEKRSGYVDIMPPARRDQYKALLPAVADPSLSAILTSSNTMWYDKETIVPGYQDSMGDPEGMRPNTIDPGLIDLAVPGGHRRLFATSGRFNFPFGTGGLDSSSNFTTINFWVPPRDGDRVLPVAYWKLGHSRWRWFFPAGTVFGEVLFVKYSDNDLRVFEIRTRTRTLTGWEVDIFRPFPTAADLAAAVKAMRPSWNSVPALKALVTHLETPATLTPYALETRYFPGTFPRLAGHLDKLPPVSDLALAKQLLRETTFRSVRDLKWKSNGTAFTHAPSTDAVDSIVPKQYDGGMFEVTSDFCKKCHQDAGRSIRDFHDDLMLYGEIWGEDETFSWHPFETTMFVDRNGRVVNFNDDNRRMRSDFANAGLVELYNPGRHPATFYKELPRSWVYRPVR